MGFLKRFLSLGSKKNKKSKRTAVPADESGLAMDFRYRPALADDESEAVANKLLRSSSARYAAMPEVDPESLPPLPHPIDRVLMTPTGSSGSTSLRNSSYSKGSYKVTVHQKERYTGTTGSAYDSPSEHDVDDPITPKPRRQRNEQDTSAVIRLRSDPSVASLLELYDNHGRLPEQAFSNTSPSPPPTPSQEPAAAAVDGRAQTRRNGSTLRQLLGSPSTRQGNNTTACEGDISWAERFLGEQSACSSMASLALPREPRISPNNSITPVFSDNTFSSDYDRSASVIDQCTISSLDVEMSTASSATPAYVSSSRQTSPELPAPTTPQRAIDVFGFLATKRRSRAPEEVDLDRSLPDPPSTFSTPSSAHSVLPSRFSTDTFDTASDTSAIPSTHDTSVADTVCDIFTSYKSMSHDSQPSRTHAPPPLPSKLPLAPSSVNDQAAEEQRQVKVIMTIPTTVMVTAPTPNHYMDRYGSRIPRGPRLSSKSPATKERRSRKGESTPDHTHPRSSHHLSSSSKDHFTAIPSRPRKMQRRMSSTSSATSSISRSRVLDKENGNGLGLTAKAELPSTPLRNGSGRQALLRAVVTPGVFVQPDENVPSPASSSELSPMGRKVMTDARKQRFGPRQRA